MALLVLALFSGVPAATAQGLLPAGGPGPAAGIEGQTRPQDGHGDVMTKLLHWAVEHSDPSRLAEIMQKYRDGNLTIKDAYGQEVLDALFPDEASIMKDTIRQVANFRNASLTDEALDAALLQLQELVEQIDNAGNLHRMGGLLPLLELGLGIERRPATRALALWTLGVAVQNNPPVQDDLAALDGLRRIVERLPQCHGGQGDAAEEEDAAFCGKLLFALSGLVRNNETLQHSAAEMGALDWLFDVGLRHPELAVAKKALGLLDTILAQSPDLPVLADLTRRQEPIAASLLAHVRGEGATEADTDAAEKALRLVGRLLSVRPSLFAPGFQQQLAAAVGIAAERCARAWGAESEVCGGLGELAAHAELALAARSSKAEDL